MDLSVSKTISRILKVNHAGEFGAIRIYRAQVFVARYLIPDLVPFLSETLGHEIDHCLKFRAAMPERGSRPCYAMGLWGIGGYTLGLITALMGRNAVMVCTKAVEATVHQHLTEQLVFLEGRDEALKSLIADIQIQEIGHLDYAQAHICPSPFNAPLEGLIVVATEIVIWLSTQGAVTRMTRALEQA
ncbi:demethoxyubiquinone hydroxylase family protein [Asticcacaulis sp. BYS171W]|uniref:Demethoxyubiquinone hydroxylase family protein n=1 Tax=Asticcacaulis aquaticus TaxID=2984212 RepID=A0ABT5HXN0_9CAUL|nr:demethoxyubiquinone hydroxylase family protein [Asticcacaulis aquaticus]